MKKILTLFFKPAPIFIFYCLITSLFFSCSHPYAIKDDKFSASNVCNGIGKIEIKTINGKLTATQKAGTSYQMIRTGGPSIWCNGLTHIWVGTSVFEGYTFSSDTINPLHFKVDRDKHYYYENGKGTITTPDGNVIKLGY